MTAQFIDFGPKDVDAVDFSLVPIHGIDVAERQAVHGVPGDAQDAEATFTITIPETCRATLPLAEHLFDDDFLCPQIEVLANAACDGGDIELRMPLYVDIAAPVSVEFADSPYLVRRRHGRDAGGRPAAHQSHAGRA